MGIWIGFFSLKDHNLDFIDFVDWSFDWNRSDFFFCLFGFFFVISFHVMALQAPPPQTVARSLQAPTKGDQSSTQGHYEGTPHLMPTHHMTQLPHYIFLPLLYFLMDSFIEATKRLLLFNGPGGG